MTSDDAAVRTNQLQRNGWILSFVLPIGGVIVGIILMTKDRVGVGIAQLVVSLFMMNFWAGFFPAFFAALAG